MCNTTLCYITSCSEPAIRVSRCNARATEEDDRNAEPCHGWETRVKPRKVRKKYCSQHTREYLDKKQRESELLELTAPSRRRHEEKAQRSSARYYDGAGYCDPGEYYDRDGRFDQALLDGDFSLAQKQTSRPSTASNAFLPRMAHYSYKDYRSESPIPADDVPNSYYASHYQERPPHDYVNPGMITSDPQASKSSWEASSSRSRHHRGDDKGDRHGSPSTVSHRH